VQERSVGGSLVDLARRDWPLDGADPDADVQAWRRGGELYEDDDDPAALLRAGELMARAVRHHVHGDDVLRDDDLAVTVQSLLFAASTPQPGADDVHEQACRLARLALAVIAQQAWQPADLGGNGQLPREVFADADIRRVLDAAVAPADLATLLRTHPS
jgi:hypothetical protein